MSGKLKPRLAIAAACLLTVLGVTGIGVAVWSDLDAGEREVLAQIMPSRLGLVVLTTLCLCAAFGWLVHALYGSRMAKLARLADESRLMLGPNRERRLALDKAMEFAALARVVNELADERDALQHDVGQRIREARDSLEEERNRLAALMSELQQSVVVCNLDGLILLYNTRARLQFQALGDTPAAGGSASAIGLGRSIFTILERNMITHALENIQLRLKRGVPQPGASFLTATRAGQLLRVRMAPVLSGAARDADGGERGIGGYVLMLDNITRDFERETRRDQMLQSLTEGSRASLASIRAAVETLHDYPDMETVERDGFVDIIGEEVRNLSQRLDQSMNEHADSMKARWPLEEMLGVDLIAAAQRRIESRVGIRTGTDVVDEGLWLKVDSFSLLQGLAYLAHRLHEDFGVRDVRFRLEKAGRLAYLDMLWAGTQVAMETLHEWELDPMNVGGETSLLTLRDVTERHGGEIWYQRDTPSQTGFCRLLLPAAAPQDSLPASALLHGDSRPDYYDFDLFKQLGRSHALDDRLLTELTYTAFDTETTGLDPAGGDEIIQIGAARIVNGRLLKNEYFDQLVDPKRPLSPESIAIHGITEDMLEGKPAISQVLPAFHAFCEDTVLVGHNAAFDMRFLQLKEQATGVVFAQPVLDTLLLSPVIHPTQESHKLEAIAERFGVPIVGRHSALGDTMVTAEVFLKMIPLLAQMGIRTLREAREAAEKTYYARAKY
jgi:DNA polymerase-3 subunit epsilon